LQGNVVYTPSEQRQDRKRVVHARYTTFRKDAHVRETYYKKGVMPDALHTPMLLIHERGIPSY